jgi:MtN3 and saliva related transmembrane protein
MTANCHNSIVHPRQPKPPSDSPNYFLLSVVTNENVMENLVAYADIIGTVAGILVLTSFIPQLMKAYKTKKMFDVSAHLMILIASGMFLWVIYGSVRSDPVIIGTNAAGFALNIALLVMKFRYDKMSSSTAAPLDRSH